LRAFVTALAAQSDLTIDEVEDLQIAVDESCALILRTRDNPADSSPRTSSWRCRPSRSW